MSNAHHIFSHFDFLYILDFNNMLCWSIGGDEPIAADDPVTALDIVRESSSTWSYRLANTTAPFQKDSDTDWTFKVESCYRSYLKTLLTLEAAENQGR